MQFSHLPFNSPLSGYEGQAEQLLQALLAGDPRAARVFRHHLPRFLRPDVPWLARDVADRDVFAAGLTLDDARTVVARGYSFLDWPGLASWVNEVAQTDSRVATFETAVEAVIGGRAEELAALLTAHPWLVHARSTRVNCFDPPVHGAMLLHYLAANGVEGHRQKSPANAVEIARLLLNAGADPDALAALYGGECTTMSLLVSSGPPAEAGVQVPLVEALVSGGASVEVMGTGNWRSPLMTALAFNCMDAAQALVRLGATVDELAIAAGLGRDEEAARLLDSAGPDERHRALALASQLGHAAVVRLLLDAGENPDRYNPEGLHKHATPLHHAALHGHLAVVRLLAERGARLDMRDTTWQATPLGWAEHGGHEEIAAYLRSASGLSA